MYKSYINNKFTLSLTSNIIFTLKNWILENFIKFITYFKLNALGLELSKNSRTFPRFSSTFDSKIVYLLSNSFISLIRMLIKCYVTSFYSNETYSALLTS